MNPLTIDIIKGQNLAIAKSIDELLGNASKLDRIKGNHYQLTFTPVTQQQGDNITDLIASFGSLTIKRYV
jgi:hypothetical protein